MSDRTAASARHPWVWAALYFPYGLSVGFPSIALGFLARRAGVPVATVAGIVGMPLLAAGWKFTWAPLGDYTLSRKRWYLVAVALIALGLTSITLVPLAPRTVPLVSALVLLTSVAATFLAFATEGLLVHNTAPDARGRAAGWFQSGNQFGQTAGGGIGLWLIDHTPAPWMAGLALSAIVAACALVLTLVDDAPRDAADTSVGGRALDAWRSLVDVLRSRVGRVALVLAILPIGTGASQYLFGTVGSEWHASADVVSLVLGLGGGCAVVAGCFVGGRLADRMDRPWSYALSCALGVVVCVVMALAPRTSPVFAMTTLGYTFSLGMVAATFTALVLSLVGRTAAATKINLFFAINTLFSLFVLRGIGTAHDAWGTNGMLYTEAVLGVLAIGLFAALVGRVRGAAEATREAAVARA